MGVTNTEITYFIGKFHSKGYKRVSHKTKNKQPSLCHKSKTKLFYILSKNNDLNIIDLNMGNSFFNDIMIIPDKKSNLIIAGLFSDSHKKNLSRILFFSSKLDE